MITPQPAQIPTAKPLRLLRLKEVLTTTGLSRASVYKKINQGEFPSSVSLGERAVAWVESEINDWVSSKIHQRDNAS